jgi:hypothetical protein
MIGASLLVAAAVTLASLSCGDRPPPSPAASLPTARPTSAPDSRDHEVVAVVEEIMEYGRKERAQDGSVSFFTVVALAVVEPRLPERVLTVYTQAVPAAVAGRPLVLGDRLRFNLPKDYATRDLHLLELPNVRFADSETATPSPSAAPAEQIVATIAQVTEGGYVEFLPDGGKRWSNLVVLALDQPSSLPALLRLHSATLRIGDRKVKVGDRLTFVKPSYTHGLALSDLKELRFVN